jgi:hypothetical protein
VKYLLIALFLISCGDEKSEIVTQQPMPPPIPPIVRHEPLPTPPPTNQETDNTDDPSGPYNPEPEPVPAPTHDQYLNMARQKYPHIFFREVPGFNAMTQRIGHNRWMISMGAGLKYIMDSEQYLLIVAHEVSHTYSGASEVLADYNSISRARRMMQAARRRTDNRKMTRVARRNTRWLQRRTQQRRSQGMPPSRTHPTPRKRYKIYQKAIKRQKLKRADHFYYL